MKEQENNICAECKEKEIKKSCVNCACKNEKKEERWYHKWRHWAAYIYLIICVFDFLGMPIFYAATNMRPTEALELSMKFGVGSEQLTALQIFMNERIWDPITLRAGGLFHLAFGAILGIASFTRGQEKIKKLN